MSDDWLRCSCGRTWALSTAPERCECGVWIFGAWARVNWKLKDAHKKRKDSK